MEKVRRWAAAYFAFQGIAFIGWWVILVAYPETRATFRIERGSDTSLLSFLLPDILIAIGSILAAFLIYLRNQLETAVMWLVTGAITYATVFTFAFTMMTGYGWLGVALMLPATLWSGVFATGLSVGHSMFRQSKVSSTNYVLVKTFTQIIVVWSMILIVFPYLITLLEDRLGIERLTFPYQRPIAIGIFALVSSIGVWASYSMSRIGRGTPLPLDHASELVVVGPYAYVRNPMAVSGILQGLAVALFLGSPLVAVYALIGSAIWQLIFRPLEEDDLAVRFGDSFESYRANVRCWIPRYPSYQIDSTVDSSNSVTSPLGKM